MNKKVRCRICGKWTYPNPRVGARQRTCGSADCRREWQKRRCSEYRRKNLAEERAFRIEQRVRSLVERSCDRGSVPEPGECRNGVRALIRSETTEMIGKLGVVLDERCRAVIRPEVTRMTQQFRVQVPLMVRAVIEGSEKCRYGGDEEVNRGTRKTPTGWEIRGVAG